MTEREAFEAEFRKRGCELGRGPAFYYDHPVEDRWTGWQARAELDPCKGDVLVISRKLLTALLDGDSNVSLVAAQELRAILAEK